MTERPPRNLLTRLLLGIGYLTDPKSPPGKVFHRCETGTSAVFERLAHNHTFLRLAGKGLNLGFMLRRSMTAGAEAWLHAWQAPTLGDVQAMRTQLRQLGDRLEVTQTQLELALDTLARVEAGLRLSTPTATSTATPT
jgi:hypothetical protein